MPLRAIWILLFTGILCVSMSAAQNKKQDQNTGLGGAQPPAAQTPAPAADPVADLKAKVDGLDKEVKGLKASLSQNTPADPVQALNSSLQVATWVTLVIAVLILASVIWLWNASKKLNGMATATIVNDARDAVTNAVNDARDSVRNDATNAVNAARDATHNDMTNAVQAVNAARDAAHNDATNAAQAVNAARDAAHNDVIDLLQSLRETRSSLQGTLDELKSKINTPPSR